MAMLILVCLLKQLRGTEYFEILADLTRIELAIVNRVIKSALRRKREIRMLI